MIPSVFQFVGAMPRTASGKIDRARLRSGALSPSASATPPRFAEEELLASVWAHVLRAENIGIDSDYFALGGDSIRAIQIISLARSLGLELTFEALSRHRTIRGLASSLRLLNDQQASPRALPFSLIGHEDRQKLPSDVADAYPLARLQAGMLYHRDYLTGSAIYYDVSSFHMRLPYDEPCLRIAVTRLIARHPILRT